MPSIYSSGPPFGGKKEPKTGLIIKGLVIGIGLLLIGLAVYLAKLGSS